MRNTIITPLLYREFGKNATCFQRYERVKRKFGIFILLIICFLVSSAFTGCKTEDLSSLRSLSKPHLCTYECESATLAGKDVLGHFQIILLELRDGGKFLLTAKPRKGRAIRQEGRYTFDEDSQVLTMSATRGKKPYTKAVTVERGSFTVSKSIGGRELVLKFKVQA